MSVAACLGTGPPEPVQLTSGPIRWNTPIPSKDGTKIFAQGVILRGELVRFDAQSHQLEPWLGGHLRRVCLLLSGRPVRDLRYLPGGRPVEGQSGRKQSGATHRSSHVSPVFPVGRPTAPRFCSSEATAAKLPRSFPGRRYTPVACSRKRRGERATGSWSPDGRKIVFCSFKSEEEISSLNYDLRVLDLGSHQITTLPGSHGTFSPRWSPNGRFIAGLHLGAPGGLTVFDFETQRWFVLPEKGEIDWPTWSSNSQFIYFYAPGGANRECFESAFQMASRSALSI